MTSFGLKPNLVSELKPPVGFCTHWHDCEGGSGAVYFQDYSQALFVIVKLIFNRFASAKGSIHETIGDQFPQ